MLTGSTFRPEWGLEGLLLGVALLAAYWDIRHQRIPNWLTVGGFAVAFLLRTLGGWGMLGSGLAAAGIGFVVLLPLFVVGGMGGGDVKLLTTGGMLVGLGRLPELLMYTAFAGGVLAVAAITLYGDWLRVFLNLRAILKGIWTRVIGGKPLDNGAPLSINSTDALTIPYGVAIAAGSLLAWYVV